MMSNTDLLSDEKIIYRTKKHPIIFFNAILWTLISIFIYYTIIPRFAMALSSIPLATQILLINTFSALPWIACAFFWASAGILYATSDFTITTKRLIMREGFFIRHTSDTRLSTVSHLNIDQSLIGQALNYGTITINSFGGNRDGFMQIANAKKFQNSVQEQLNKITH